MPLNHSENNIVNLSEYCNRAEKQGDDNQRVNIIFTQNSSIRGAHVKSLSAYGATLILENINDLPQQFDVEFLQDELTMPCQLVWRHNNCVRITF